jgi:hypothetical protein
MTTKRRVDTGFSPADWASAGPAGHRRAPQGWWAVPCAGIGEPRFHLATRPLLPQHDGAARILAHDVERVLADIDADHGDRGIGRLRHGVLLVFGAPCQLRLLAGQEHGRTIPLADIASRSATACLSSATIPTWWAWGLIQSVVLIRSETTCRSVW